MSEQNILKDLGNTYTLSPFFTFAFCIAFIATWSILYLQTHLDVDIAGLLQFLERFLHGGVYGRDFYETNPPLSFLIYLPAYPLYNVLGISAKLSVTLIFMGYIALSNITVFQLLQHIKLPAHIIITIIGALITAQTWGAGMTFGSRDHLILIFIAPLCLAQYLITTNQETKTTPYIVLAILMGGIALCLKPHYAVIPAAFYLHRLASTYSLKRCLLSADTVGLIIIGALYLGFIYIFTPEYLSMMYHEVVSLYVIDRPFPLELNLKFAFITVGAAFFGFLLPVISNTDENILLKKTILPLSAVSALCIIPYLIQDKGFFYHTTPYLGFAIAALSVGLYGITRLILKNKDICLWIALIITAALTSTFTTGGKMPVMTPGQFKAQPLVDIIEERAWNGVYASYDMKTMLAPLPYIMDVQNGSRFIQIWPLYALNLLLKNTTTEEQNAEIKARMMGIIDMIAEDMHRYKPSIITIPLYPTDPQSNDPGYKYYEFLMSNKNFASAMKNYERIDTVSFNTSLTTQNVAKDKIVRHDVYMLNKDNNLSQRLNPPSPK